MMLQQRISVSWQVPIKTYFDFIIGNYGRGTISLNGFSRTCGTRSLDSTEKHSLQQEIKNSRIEIPLHA